MKVLIAPKVYFTKLITFFFVIGKGGHYIIDCVIESRNTESISSSIFV